MEQTQKVTLELTVQQVNVVLAGVVKLPLEASLDTFNTIQQQANAQLGAPTQTAGPLADKVV